MSKSNITKGKGGIQAGSSATTKESKKLDDQLKHISKKLIGQYPGFVYHSGHTKKRILFEDIRSGCVPDGGLWLDSHNKVRLAFEAKVQGKDGNAIERHSKNLMVCNSFKSESGFRYVTFLAGEGAAEKEVLHNYAITALRCNNTPDMRDLNTIHDNGVSFFLSVDGWTDQEIETIMKEAFVK